MGGYYDAPRGFMLRGQLGMAVSNFIDNIPNMSDYEIGHAFGYGVEKLAESVALTRGLGLSTNVVRGGATTWNGFQKMTAGQFVSRAEAATAWSVYKNANGIVTGTTRSIAQRNAFLRGAAISGKYPSWMKPWLSKGKVPPGYHVDHYKALFDGGLDIPANMRLKDISTHITRHRYYRP